MTSGDWDYSSENWVLDGTKYVSAPTSWRTDAEEVLSVLIKTANVPIASVKEGRISTYNYYQSQNPFDIIFRYQDANNYYYVHIEFSFGDFIATVYRVLAGVPTNLGSGTLEKSYTQWIHWRVTWWNDYVGLVIRVELYHNDSWYTLCQKYDAANHWKTIGGRCGFRINSGSPAFNAWIDNTNIYGVVE